VTHDQIITAIWFAVAIGVGIALGMMM